MSALMRLIALLFGLGHAAAIAAIHLDDAGRQVDIASPPQRIITIAPNLTELVYAVGAGAALIGTVDTSDYPQDAKAVPRIGNAERLDIERIVSLKPDLILVWLHGNPGREVAQLEAAGLRLFYLEPRRLDDVPRAIERVGALLGHEAQGRDAAADLRKALNVLRETHANAAPVTVFYQVWSQPLMTLNDQHLVSDVIALCRGRNVFGALPQLVPQLSIESVVAADPEAMFTASEFATVGPQWRRDPKHRAFATWSRFAKLTAVRRGWMFAMAGDVLNRQGPRIAQGAAAACAALDEVRKERGR